MTTGKSIARIRRQKRWTQAKLAMETGLSRGYIASIEEDRVQPKLKTLAIIADRLGVSVSELIKRRR